MEERKQRYESIDNSLEAFCCKREKRVTRQLEGDVGTRKALLNLRWETLDPVCMLIEIMEYRGKD